ncbi:MAG TPA: 50S ribosomal protein L17 [Candidatus Gastranaerophilales bacterium]|nr:50S ribosomal protein L17 [Candidatus Gastranaerophilales bacterium]
MRHQKKVKKLGRPQDQRKALLRSLATSLFMHGEIQTTMTKAKALKSYAEKIISFAKKGDLHARRLASALIYDQEILNETETAEEKDEKSLKVTVLRKLFSEIGPKNKERNGGYTQIFRTGFRRGDNAEMALIRLI